MPRDLLPQPGGFEGFGLTAAGAPPNDSLVTPLGEYPAHLLDHGRGTVHAVRPMRADARGAERPVAKLANLIEAEAEVRKGTKEVLPPLPHAVVSVIVATDSGEQWLDLAIRVVERDEHVKVVPGEGIKGPVRKLDVLLRHRLLPQPGGFEGLGAIKEDIHPRDSTVAERQDVRG